MKQPILFLHGALGCRLHWERFLDPFYQEYDVHNINFPGHGDNSELLAEYSCETLADFLKRYILEHQLKNCILTGYSMGGYIALSLAAQQPRSIHSVITLATKLDWNSKIAKVESDKLTEENLEPLRDKLLNEHGHNRNGLLERTKSILLSIGHHPLNKASFTTNSIPVALLRGTKDRMVSEEETIAFADGLPHFKTIELHNQPHLLERMDKDILCNTILQILSESDKTF